MLFHTEPTPLREYRSVTRSEYRHLFEIERKRFARLYPWVEKVRLNFSSKKCTPGSPCGIRDLGYCEPNRSTITMLERSLALPKENVIALLRHELGHCSDLAVGSKGSEQRADDIAEFVTGQRIRYDGNDVQTIGKGRYPRPKYLHR